ncbi:hypothetical protein, partial [Magnetovibrio blakemorei]|uniref:hypothetical protein n=1 Tax=Magnetovibrio blakemorei TaxID=28181 RepID=UPI001B8A97FE
MNNQTRKTLSLAYEMCDHLLSRVVRLLPGAESGLILMKDGLPKQLRGLPLKFFYIVNRILL